jgi:hypothetical protein
MTTTRRHFLDTAAGDSGVTLSKVRGNSNRVMAPKKSFMTPKGYSAHFEHHRNFIAAVRVPVWSQRRCSTRLAPSLLHLPHLARAVEAGSAHHAAAGVRAGAA